MIPEIHNGKNDWQRDFRYGWFDMVLAKYAFCVLDSEIDSLAITNVDRLNYFHTVRVCTSYIIENPPDNLEDFFSCQREDGYAKITSINVLTNQDSDHQKELTKLLNRCIPVYQNFPGWKSVDDDNLNRYLELLTKELNTPIEIVSFGPTRNDKKRH
jgi:adenylosuccinate synthase